MACASIQAGENLLLSREDNDFLNVLYMRHSFKGCAHHTHPADAGILISLAPRKSWPN